MDFRITKSLVYFAGAVFLTGAAIRFAILAQNTHLSRLLVNKAQDPLLGFNVRHEVWTVGLAESVLAAVCLWNFKLTYRVALIAWAVTNYFVFRAGLYSQHLKLQTSCIGALSDPWQIANGIPGRCLGVIPYILLVGSYGLLLWQWHQGFRQQRREKATHQDVHAGLVKMSCPACGGHIINKPMSKSARHAPDLLKNRHLAWRPFDFQWVAFFNGNLWLCPRNFWRSLKGRV